MSNDKELLPCNKCQGKGYIEWETEDNNQDYFTGDTGPYVTLHRKPCVCNTRKGVNNG